MKSLVTFLISWCARRRLKRFKGSVIAVAGSAGKTSTIRAVTTLLATNKRVLSTRQNFNTEIGLSLVVLELELPDNTTNPLPWMQLTFRAFMRAVRPLPYEVIVLELGVDKPGDMSKLIAIVKPYITVLTSLDGEHLEFFKSVEAAQAEELVLTGSSQITIFDTQSISPSLQEKITSPKRVPVGPKTRYQLQVQSHALASGYTLKIIANDDALSATCNLLGVHSLRAVLLAIAVAGELGLSAKQIVAGVEAIQPVSGRMRLFEGVEDDTWVIDDTYNAVGVEPVTAALDTLYSIKSPQRIAILGSMNELGSFSKQAHETVGSYCDPLALDFVVTVGKDAANYLAPAAKAKGCRVFVKNTPVEAGEFVLSRLQPKGVVLVKGSQNGVFLEEAVKLLLRNSDDEDFLVRQSDTWMAKKRAQGLL